MLTKAEIGKVSAEQQEIFARMELREAQHHQKLLELAHGRDWRSRYFPIYLFACFLVFITLYYFNVLQIQAKPFILFLPIALGLVFTLVFHISRLNRRLDALIELLESDRKAQEDRKIQSEEKNS